MVTHIDPPTKITANIKQPPLFNFTLADLPCQVLQYEAKVVSKISLGFACSATARCVL